MSIIKQVVNKHMFWCEPKPQVVGQCITLASLVAFCMAIVGFRLKPGAGTVRRGSGAMQARSRSVEGGQVQRLAGQQALGGVGRAQALQQVKRGRRCAAARRGARRGDAAPQEGHGPLRGVRSVGALHRMYRPQMGLRLSGAPTTTWCVPGCAHAWHTDVLGMPASLQACRESGGAALRLTPGKHAATLLPPAACQAGARPGGAPRRILRTRRRSYLTLFGGGGRAPAARMRSPPAR
jgi:hypothetical protein